MGKKDLIFVFGEVLADIYLDTGEERIGGAPFNFAYHLNKLGFETKFISKIGNDSLGNRILKYCNEKKFPVHDIAKDYEYPTGRVEIKLNEKKVPDFHILEETAYDYIVNQMDEEIFTSNRGFIYYGSLAQRNSISRRTLRKYLESARNWEKFFDVNIRYPYISEEVLIDGLENCTILKLNEDELRYISDFIGIAGLQSKTHIEKILEKISMKFHIHTICLTLGEKGSMIFQDGNFTDYRQEPIEVVDTVGAGDGFSALFCEGISRKRPIEEILERASRFAGKICGQKGAVLKDSDYLEFKI